MFMHEIQPKPPDRQLAAATFGHSQSFKMMRKETRRSGFLNFNDLSSQPI
jgi:hypothetical protein